MSKENINSHTEVVDILSTAITTESLKHKNIKPSTEDIATIFLGGIFAVGFGLSIYDKWKQKRKDRKKFEAEVISQSKLQQKKLKETLLNPKWIDKLNFKTGEVSVSNANVFAINGKIPANPIEAIQKTLNVLYGLDNKLASDYSKYGSEVENITSVIEKTWNDLTEEKYFAQIEKEPNYYKNIYNEMDKKLGKVVHPLLNKWKTLPNGKEICGGFVYTLNDKDPKYKFSQYTDYFYKVTSTASKSIVHLPALTKEQVLAIGKLINNVLEKQIKNNSYIFPICIGNLYKIPYIADGWPYEHVSGLDSRDVFPELELGDGVLGEMTGAASQNTDPIWELDWIYQKTIGELINALIHWVEASCGVKLIENKPSTESLYEESKTNMNTKELNDILSFSLEELHISNEDIKDTTKNIGSKIKQFLLKLIAFLKEKTKKIKEFISSRISKIRTNDIKNKLTLPFTVNFPVSLVDGKGVISQNSGLLTLTSLEYEKITGNHNSFKAIEIANAFLEDINVPFSQIETILNKGTQGLNEPRESLNLPESFKPENNSRLKNLKELLGKEKRKVTVKDDASKNILVKCLEVNNKFLTVTLPKLLANIESTEKRLKSIMVKIDAIESKDQLTIIIGFTMLNKKLSVQLINIIIQVNIK